MSSALTIAAITAAIKDLLVGGLQRHDDSRIESFTVTSLPPDRIPTGKEEQNQLNVFLYQVTPSMGRRNEALPSRDTMNEHLPNPPLALDLHYLITAYGADDLHAEILLGCALRLLHETPLIRREMELLKVSPVNLNTEELSRLWTSMHAPFRLSMAYVVSGAVIQG